MLRLKISLVSFFDDRTDGGAAKYRSLGKVTHNENSRYAESNRTASSGEASALSSF